MLVGEMLVGCNAQEAVTKDLGQQHCLLAKDKAPFGSDEAANSTLP